jgi:dCMP deaminase
VEGYDRNGQQVVYGRGGSVTSKVDWDDRFMRLALTVATWSKDRSTQVGAVIVGSNNDVRAIGYNGFPRGIDDEAEERHERPLKYRWTEHAERNAIYVAARSGISIANCRMYLPWFPCMDCARGIVQAGLIELIAFQPDLSHKTWGDDFRYAIELFKEVGLSVRWLNPDFSKDQPQWSV